MKRFLILCGFLMAASLIAPVAVAQSDSAAVAKAATAGNMDEAGTQVKNPQANCVGCHMAHREGTARLVQDQVKAL